MNALKAAYASAMEALYIFCATISGLCIVIITLVIPWGVYTRYVLNSGSQWPEPLAVLLVILFTFFAAAACYRANVHIAVTMFVGALSPFFQKLCKTAVDLLMLLLALFMVIWGIKLVETTWYSHIAEFPFLSVGVTYLPIPLGGAFTFLFIVEQMWIGTPGPDSFVHREPVSLD
jgi:TRAP-type C4-dicarboxylate transport system permease small subunit